MIHRKPYNSKIQKYIFSHYDCNERVILNHRYVVLTSLCTSTVNPSFPAMSYVTFHIFIVQPMLQLRYSMSMWMRNVVMGWLSHKNSKVKAPSTQQHKVSEAVATRVSVVKDNDIRSITMEKAVDLTFWW